MVVGGMGKIEPSTFRQGVDLDMRDIRDTQVVYLQHLVRAGLHPEGHVAGVEGHLLHLGKVVAGVPVEHQFAHRDQRVFLVGPHLRRQADGEMTTTSSSSSKMAPPFYRPV